jgi:hypothetical protein
MVVRYGKSKLALESSRVWSLENRLKLLGMITLAYDFLWHLLNSVHRKLVETVMNLKCRYTGEWQQEVQIPLYRLRWAMNRLLERSRPTLGALFPPGVQTVLAAQRSQC